MHQMNRFWLQKEELGTAPKRLCWAFVLWVWCFWVHRKGGLTQVHADRWDHVRGDLGADWCMVSILFSVRLCCSRPPLLHSSFFFCVLVCLYSETKGMNREFQNVYFHYSTKSFITLAERENETERERVQVRHSCVVNMCVLLAGHVQEAGRWNPSTANYPNTINPNRCFTMLNAVTWRPDTCLAIPFLLLC